MRFSNNYFQGIPLAASEENKEDIFFEKRKNKEYSWWCKKSSDSDSDEKVDSDRQSKADSSVLEKRAKIIYFLFYEILCENQGIYNLLERNSQFLD